MKKSDNPADAFKKALAEATKVMADDAELNVSYSVDPSGLSGDAMRLPQVSRRMTREEVLLARGTADALALNRRYHDADTHARYAPQGDMARELYEAMETARCEAMGARDMPGTAGNIDVKIKHEALRRGYDQAKQASDVPLSVAAGYMVRHMATGRPLPAGAENAMELWRGFIEDQAGGTLEGIDGSLADQADFARLARKMISDLGYGDQLGDDPDSQDDEQEDQAEEGSEEEQDPDSTGQDDQDEEEAEGTPENSQEQQQQDESQAQVSMDDEADQELGDEADMPEGDAPMDPPPPPPVSDADPEYRVYLGEHDEVIGAEELAEPIE
ncbi:MAG TPA: cobaltochelatase subunit CobT, partial [Sulfitobacter sp.]|nr:cobaltochelatase subunit CobT [Sulfitobacter sp.]